MTKAVLFAILAGMCWGLGELVTKRVLASREIGPMGLLVMRTLVALPPSLIAFWLLARVWPSETPKPLSASTGVLAMALLGSGLLAGFGGVFFFYRGLAVGEISVVKPIAFALAPAIAAVCGWLFLGESMTARKGVGIALLIAGLVLVTTGSHGHSPKPEGEGEGVPGAEK
jgi:drug/metabolite transporter (DMT)-like permease